MDKNLMSCVYLYAPDNPYSTVQCTCGLKRDCQAHCAATTIHTSSNTSHHVVAIVKFVHRQVGHMTAEYCKPHTRIYHMPIKLLHTK